MMSHTSRREFLRSLGALSVCSVTAVSGSALPGPDLAASPFRISVINDEISQDFGRACEVASRQFGMKWIELRGMWNKNVLSLDAKEIAESRRILEKYNLKVTDIASPLFK